MNNIYYRGYEGKYGVFDSNNNESFTWLTNSLNYALWYSHDQENGKVAKIKLNTDKLLNLEGQNFPDDTDPIDTDDSNMKEFVYSKGFDGVIFTAPEGNYKIIAVRKDKCQIVEPAVNIKGIKDIWGEGLKESNNYDVYYRGYDGNFGPLDNNNSYVWLTNSYEYAAQYTEEKSNGKVAKIALLTTKLGTLNNLTDNIDYFDPGDDTMEDYIYSQGMDGYTFELEDNTLVVCVNKDKVKVLDSDYKENIDESKAVKSTSFNQVEQVLKNSEYFKVSKEPTDTGFILPDGLFVNTSDDNINGWHCDLEDYLDDKGLADSNSDKIYQENNNGYGAPSLEKFGAIRISEGEDYVCLPPVKPTEAAYSSLLAWLDKYIEDCNKYLPSGYDLQVTNYDGNQYQEYSIKDNTADEILAKIKHYFTTGKLVETKLNEVISLPTPILSPTQKKDMIDYIKLQHNTVDDYTGDAMYLTPDGKFIDMGDYHNQEDMIDYLGNIGLIDDKYLNSGDVIDLEDNFAENVLGMVHCGSDSYIYVGFPEKEITEQQYEALDSIEKYYINKQEGIHIEIYNKHYPIPSAELYYDEDTNELHDKYDKKTKLKQFMKHYYNTGKFTMVENLKEDNIVNQAETDNLGKQLTKEQVEFFKDSKIRNKDGKLIHMYHGTTIHFNSFNRPINWFSVSDKYSKGFSSVAKLVNSEEVMYDVYLNCKKVFYCGNTSIPCYGLVPIRPYQLSAELTALMRKLGATETDIRPLLDQAEKGTEEGKELMTKLYMLTNLPDFAKLVISKGYDSIYTIEDGHGCIGVFNPSDIKAIDNLKPTNSTNINEKLILKEEQETSEKDNLGNALTYAQSHYFKNSKIRDSKGNLLVCYHGTEKANFLTFNPVGKKVGNYKYNKSIVNFFAASKSMASSYAGTHDDANTKMPSDKAGIYNVYLNIVSPYVFDANNSNWRGLHDKSIRKEQIDLYNKFIDEWDRKRIQYIADNITKLNIELRPIGYKLKKDSSAFGDNEYELFSTYEGGHFEPPEKRISIDYGLVEVNDLLDSQEWKEDFLGDGSSQNDEDNYYQTTNDIVAYALNKNRQAGYDAYDGVIIKNVIDSGQYGFADAGDIYITISSPNQIKSIHNQNPTVGFAINEDMNEIDSEGNKLSPKQIEYFKDSKVRDLNGCLSVVYHGTKTNFNEFKDASGLYYFSYDEDYASGYSDNNFGNAEGNEPTVLKCYLKAKHILDLTDLGVDYSWWVKTNNNVNDLGIDYTDKDKKGNYYNNYSSDDEQVISCENKYGSYKGWVPSSDFVRLAKYVKTDWKDLADFAIILIQNKQTTDCSISTIENSKEFRQLLINAGYDAFIQEETEGTAIAVIDANQIKLTKNTTPTSGNRIDEADFDFDYGTGNVVGDNIFDTRQLGGYSEYEQTIPGNKWYQYMINEKNLKGEIVQMSPNEYFRICALDIFNHNGNDKVESPEELKKNRGYEMDEIKKLEKIITDRKKQFPMCFIDYAHYGQEGLHRMYAAGELFGWNHKFPVLVIDWADKDKQAAYEKDKKLRETTYKVNTAVDKALRYKGYSSLDEFKNQLYTELEDQFYETTSFDLKTDEKNDKFTVTVKDVTIERPYSKINFENKDINESEVEDAVYKYLYVTKEPKPGSCYLMPNGDFLFCDKNTLLGTHGEHTNVVANQSGLDYDDIDAYIGNNSIELNSDEYECRVEFVSKPTDEQYSKLLDWLYFIYQDLGNTRVEIQNDIQTNSKNGKYTSYIFKDTLPEEIIKDMKIIISDKKESLTEEIEEWKSNLLKCVYYWFKDIISTTPIERCFIMPDGKYIETVYGDAHYETESYIRDVFYSKQVDGEWLPDYEDAAFVANKLTKEQVNDIMNHLEPNNWDGGSVTMEKTLGAMRCNGGMERYIVISDSPMTTQQYQSLETWFDVFYSGKSSFDSKIDVCTRGKDGGFGNGNEQITYHYDETTGDDIIKKIKRYYVSGMLLESQEDKIYRIPEEQKQLISDTFKKAGYSFTYKIVDSGKLIKDNDLDNPDNLGSYHTDEWGINPSKYQYDASKDYTGKTIYSGPYAHEKFGKIILGDGKHRTKAKINAGYTKIELPVLSNK